MRLICSMLLVLTVLARALVPAGYMTQASATGGFEIVICSSDGLETILADADGNPIEPSGRSGNDSGETCPFALAGVSILTASGGLLPDFTPLAVALHPTPATDQRVRIAILAINAARAPPILA